MSYNFAVIVNEQRVFGATRRVRVGDCDAGGVIRVDALARYLQDIGYDDTDDLGVGDGGLWVARSIAMNFPEPRQWPKRNEFIQLETFCGGVGRAFAQRRVMITSEENGTIDTSTIWVSVNEEGKPTSVPSWLPEAYPYTEKVSSARTLELPDLTQDFMGVVIDWQLRASDFDINDHVNNAIAFSALYEIAHSLKSPVPSRVLVEYHQPLDNNARTKIFVNENDRGFDAWLVSDKTVVAAMQWK